MTQQIITALVLGLVGGVTPGPVLAAIFTEILQAGFYMSLRIILWALVVETMVALAGLLVLTSLSVSSSFFGVLSIVGAGVLIWMTLQLWRVQRLDTEERVRFGLVKLATMILANGVLWTYWISVCVPQAAALGTQIHFGAYLFLMLVQIGWLLSTVAIALAFSWGKILLNPRVVPLAFKFLALTFLCIALNMAYTGVMSFTTK